MNDKTIALVQDLADRLGVNIGQLIDTFIWREIAGALFWIVASILLIWFSIHMLREAKRRELDNDLDGQMVTVGVYIAVLATLVMSVCAIGSSIETLASPRAAAILEIIEAVKGGG